MSPIRTRRGPGAALLPVAVAALLLASVLLSLPAVGPSSALAMPRASLVRGSLLSLPAVRSSAESPPDPKVIAGPWWLNVSGANHGPGPGAQDSASAAWDPVDQVTVLFGGCAAVCPSNDTWLFSRGQWVNVTDPTDAPPARYGASLDFDANMQGLLLFGGHGRNGLLGDTWLYSGGRWTNLTWVSAGPAPRSYAAMAFDPQPEENGSVLFGGQLASGLTTNDTWVWRSWAGWEALSTSVAPAPVDEAGFAFSPRDGYALLYGGVEVCGVFCFGVVDQTWELYAGEWWPVQPAGATPGGRAGAAMTYAPSLGEVVLFSGINTSFAIPDDTWAFRLGSWTNITGGSLPPARADAALTGGSNQTAPLLIGGIGSSADLNDTWALEYVWIHSITMTTPLETSQTATIVILSGGSSPLSAVVDFGDGTSLAVTGPGPGVVVTHVYTSPGPVTVSANVTDAVGMTWPIPPWTETITAGPAISIRTPLPHADAGVTVHLGAAVVAPGTAPLAVTWSFGDGTSASGLNVTHAFAAAGTYSVTVNATDAVGGSSVDSASVTITPLPAVTAEVSRASAGIGEPVVLYANVTGGAAPYTYAWSFGDGNTSGSPDPVHAYRAAGTYTAQVWVNDSGGGSTHASVTVTIASAVVQPESTPLWYWAAVGALVVVGGVGAALLVLTMRRKPRI